MIATGHRSGAPTVGVTLRIDAAPHARAYRLLLAGETALGRAFGLPVPAQEAPRSRADRAAEVRALMATRDVRSNYSWASVGSFPVQGSTCEATIDLPAGLDGVVFVRAVAVSR